MMTTQVKIYDMDVEYDVVHRDIKYPRLELKMGNLLVVLPKGYRNHEKLIEKHKNWIYNKISTLKNSMEETKHRKLNLKRTDPEFRNLVHFFAEKISRELNVSFNRIYFRKMTSRWGSCSSRKNININTFLKYLPEKMIEYVVFHEMVHLMERKHNKRFWSIISLRFGDYKEIKKELFVYWLLIHENMHLLE